MSIKCKNKKENHRFISKLKWEIIFHLIHDSNSCVFMCAYLNCELVSVPVWYSNSLCRLKSQMKLNQLRSSKRQLFWLFIVLAACVLKIFICECVISTCVYVVASMFVNSIFFRLLLFLNIFITKWSCYLPKQSLEHDCVNSEHHSMHQPLLFVFL